MSRHFPLERAFCKHFTNYDKNKSYGKHYRSINGMLNHFQQDKISCSFVDIGGRHIPKPLIRTSLSLRSQKISSASTPERWWGKVANKSKRALTCMGTSLGTAWHKHLFGTRGSSLRKFCSILLQGLYSTEI